MAHKKHAHEDKQALKVRVRKIAGQLKAIEQMIEEDSECPDILTQVVSARRGLKSFAEKLMQEHMHHCIFEAEKDQSKKGLKSLLEVLERYVE
ncbi:MAG: metal-sensitive transcriptional regulator [Bacteriovoracia bacterium]